MGYAIHKDMMLALAVSLALAAPSAAAASDDPPIHVWLNQDNDFVRGDHWDYRVLGTIQTGSDAEAALVDVVQRMAGDARFDYDVVTYTVESTTAYYRHGYRDGYYPSFGVGYGYGLPYRYHIGLFSAPCYDPFFYDPFYCGPYYTGFRFAYFYDPFRYDPFFYSPYFYRPHVLRVGG